MSESKRSDGNGDSGDNGSDIEVYGRQYDQGEVKSTIRKPWWNDELDTLI